MDRPLESLVRNGSEIAEEVLAEALTPFIFLTGEEGRVVPRDRFDELGPGSKILVVLMGRTAAKMLGHKPSDEAGPTEIARVAGIPVGTAKREVRELEKRRLLESRAGKYRVPSFSQARVARILREAGGENDSDRD